MSEIWSAYPDYYQRLKKMLKKKRIERLGI